MRVSLPPSLSHSLFLSLHFSMDAGYAWQVFSTSLFFSLISLLPPSNSLSLFLFPHFLFLPVLFYEQVEVSWGKVSAAPNKGRVERRGGANRFTSFFKSVKNR